MPAASRAIYAIDNQLATNAGTENFDRSRDSFNLRSVRGQNRFRTVNREHPHLWVLAVGYNNTSVTHRSMTKSGSNAAMMPASSKNTSDPNPTSD